MTALRTTPRTEPPPRRHDEAARADRRCRRCGYGIAARTEPARCPMCGGGAWDDARPAGLAVH